MSEKNINRWHGVVQPDSHRPERWEIGSGKSWDMFEIAPITDEMLSELAQRYHYAGTPWNCRSMPLSESDREFMFLLYYSMQGLVARMRLHEKVLGEVAQLLRNCSSTVGEENRATDDEWDRIERRVQLALDGKFEELRETNGAAA